MLYQQQFIKLAATFNKKNALGMTAALIFLALLYTLFWPASINSKTSVVLEIKSGQSASEIAELLKARGLIDSVLLFKGYATLLGQISGANQAVMSAANDYCVISYHGYSSCWL